MSQDKDTMDKSQLDKLGKHFERVEKGEVKPFDPAAFERNRLPGLEQSLRELAKLPPRPVQK